MEQGSKKDLDEPEHRPPAPLPCANGCGFFGCPDTRDLCSKCFRDSLRRAEAQGHPTASASSATPAFAEQERVAAVARESKEPGQGEGTTRRPAQAKTKGKSRCAACRTKVGLMGFECRCGGVFCGAHRYSDRHDCGYDYRGAGRDAISQANPVVRADKVDKL